MEDVEYLYHYTSIESLALILKNKTIRLNPLDKMDDLQEQKTADVENLGKFIFVSSWTDDAKESIPMWKMYTDPASGVRIKLKKNPFLWHETKGEDLERVLGIPAKDEMSRSNKVKTFLDLSDMLDKGYFSPQAWNGDILVKVTYTDDNEKLVPKVAYVDEKVIHLETGALGKHKNLHWEFQHEWRYIMYFMTMNLKVDIDKAQYLFAESANKMLEGKEIPPFSFFDLSIDPIWFSAMDITFSPNMTAGNRVLLETLVEKYNPTATISESELLNLI